ncbi:uncharacterized protein B0H18DRAFT_257476 [Fomitopsis serialis]|uniref:uncharacterized protein n=1 Tax=Fomitopsis serialis TaxID=139415 RepID=UPI00200818E2|nr:uncharacterized protein B0H18DRAFT_257476 [Neoantrodia serialis]KAH9928411.1 hypothetical protein B0H18DRAFT_257476 [Neoantrodia serialis]
MDDSETTPSMTARRRRRVVHQCVVGSAAMYVSFQITTVCSRLTVVFGTPCSPMILCATLLLPRRV